MLLLYVALIGVIQLYSAIGWSSLEGSRWPHLHVWCLSGKAGNWAQPLPLIISGPSDIVSPSWIFGLLTWWLRATRIIIPGSRK